MDAVFKNVPVFIPGPGSVAAKNGEENFKKRKPQPIWESFLLYVSVRDLMN